MTYITPDFVALRAEAKHYAAQHPLPQDPRFNGGINALGKRFRGEHLPILSEAPIPPIHVVDLNPSVLGPTPGVNAITISPLDESFQDCSFGPGTFLNITDRDPLGGIFPGSLPPGLRGLGAVSLPWLGAGGITVLGIGLLLWLRRR